MIEIALVDLRLIHSEKRAFQRRDRKAKISPNLISFFGGKVEFGENPNDAAGRELSEETNLNMGNLTIRKTTTLELPNGLYTNSTPLVLHLFNTVVQSFDFEVYEGVRKEIYTLDEIVKRIDLAPTLNYVLDQLP